MNATLKERRILLLEERSSSVSGNTIAWLEAISAPNSHRVHLAMARAHTDLQKPRRLGQHPPPPSASRSNAHITACVFLATEPQAVRTVITERATANLTTHSAAPARVDTG